MGISSKQAEAKMKERPNGNRRFAGRIEVYIDEAAMGAPRMTQSDKWKQRPCVMAYRAWCDTIREALPDPPPAESVNLIEVHVLYPMPASWSEKKKATMCGERMRQKPDGDNVVKGIFDALWEDDQKLGDHRCQRRWGRDGMTRIDIYHSDGGAK